MVILIDQKFNEETASKKFERETMLNQFTTFWGNHGFSDRSRYFFNVWD